MGDKDTARRLMKENGVPTTPGTDILKDAGEAKKAAEQIGYPVLIKASAGGGGKGIRLVERPEDMERAFQTASSEAEKAFGDGRMYMEKYLDPVKHIEVQLLANEEGNIVCLGERECSIQRNNQKLIEEYPPPAVTPELRARLNRRRCPGGQGLSLCKRRHGGVPDGPGPQFLFYGDEHPAAGGAPGQRAGDGRGHRQVADPHCRRGAPGLYPEGHPRAGGGHRVPHQRQGPGQGRLFPHPRRPWVRFDTFLYEGYEIPPYYDSMLGKMIVYSSTREEAIRKMMAALSELVVWGTQNNIEDQIEIIRDERFKKGDYYTDFMKTFQGTGN